MVMKTTAFSLITSDEAVPQGFKKTEIGFIPLDWETEKIGAMAAIRTGSKNTQDHVDDGTYPFFVRSQKVERINSFSYDTEAVLTAGDGVGTGKVFHYVVGRFDVHQRVYCISNFGPRLNGRYFFYQFSRMFYNRVASMTAKSSVDSVRMDMIWEMRIPVPPIHEQGDIASALSDADALIESLDRLIAKKQTVKLAVVQQLVTGKTRLPGFSEEWETKRLGEIVSIRNEKVLPSSVEPDTLCVELEHIRQGDGRLFERSTARHSTSWKYRFFAGDVLFGRLRPYLRKFWHADREGICTTEIWPLMSETAQVDSGFLHATVQSARFIEVARISYGTHMPRADWGVMRAFEVRLPQLQEQRAISTVLTDMDAEIAGLERRRDKIAAMKHGLTQVLLTGKVRLVVPEVKA